MSLSIYMKKKINDNVVGGQAMPTIATHHYALLETFNAGTEAAAEADYSGYARVAFTNNKTNYSNADDDVNAEVNNNNEIRFEAIPASESQSIQAVAIYDASTAGNIIGYILKTATFGEGTRPEIEANEFSAKFVE